MTDSLTAHRRRVPAARVFVAAAIAAVCWRPRFPRCDRRPHSARRRRARPARPGRRTNASFAQQVVALVNQHRASLGLVAPHVDATLSDSAVWKARHMAQYGYFAHDDPAPPVARDPFTRMPTAAMPRAGRSARTSPRPADAGRRDDGLDQLAGPPREYRGAFVPRDRRRRRGRRPVGIYWVQDFGSGVRPGAPPPPPPPARPLRRRPRPPPPPPAAPPPPPPAPPPPAPPRPPAPRWSRRRLRPRFRRPRPQPRRAARLRPLRSPRRPSARLRPRPTPASRRRSAGARASSRAQGREAACGQAVCGACHSGACPSRPPP